MNCSAKTSQRQFKASHNSKTVTSGPRRNKTKRSRKTSPVSTECSFDEAKSETISPQYNEDPRLHFMSRDPLDSNTRIPRTSQVPDRVALSPTTTPIPATAQAHNPSLDRRPSDCFLLQPDLTSAISNPSLDSRIAETVALADSDLSARPLPAEGETPGFFESNTKSSAGYDISCPSTIASTFNPITSQAKNTACTFTSDIVTDSGNNVNKNWRSESCHSSNSSKTKDTTTSIKSEKSLSGKILSRSNRDRSPTPTISPIPNTPAPTTNPRTVGTDCASGSCTTTHSSNINLPTSCTTTTTTSSFDNDSTIIPSTSTGLSTTSTTSTTGTSTSSSTSTTSTSSSSTSGSSLSNMSAMDLLMQLDLPAVSDSSDTEDFLQELAAINDSGKGCLFTRGPFYERHLYRSRNTQEQLVLKYADFLVKVCDVASSNQRLGYFSTTHFSRLCCCGASVFLKIGP